MAFESFEQILVLSDNEDFDPLLPDDTDLHNTYAHCFEKDHDPNDEDYDIFSMTRQLMLELKRDWKYMGHVDLGGTNYHIYQRKDEE